MSELTKTYLIQRFQMHQTVDYHQETHQRVAHLDRANLRQASVLVGFVEREQGLNVLFTRRARHLKHHPGQVSFPGGKYEPSDSDLLHTAIRETYEEVGIEQSQIEVFGQMPALPTISQFSVTPVMAFISSDYKTNIDKNEVDEVFEVPASVVLDRQQLHSQRFRIKSTSHRVFGLSYQSHFIWGVTAQIIQAMQNHLMDSTKL